MGLMLSTHNYIADPGVVLEVNGAAGDLTAANLLTPIIQQVWRAAGSVGELTIDLGAVRDISVISFAQPRFGVILSSSSLGRCVLTRSNYGDVYDSGLIAFGVDPRRGYWLHSFLSPVQARWIFLHLEMTPYVQVGRVFAGPVIALDGACDAVWTLGWTDTDQTQRVAQSGIALSRPGARYRRLELPFSAATDADEELFERIDIDMGSSGQILVCTDPADWARRTLLGHRIASSARRSLFNRWARTLIIEEDC